MYRSFFSVRKLMNSCKLSIVIKIILTANVRNTFSRLHIYGAFKIAKQKKKVILLYILYNDILYEIKD